MNTTKLHKYCTLCGNCIAVCPANALNIKNNQIIDNQNCTSCQQCIKNCPGFEFSYPEFNNFLFKKEKTKTKLKHSIYLGYYQNILAAKSKDSQILKKASSGGIVTTFLIQALKKKFIKGAVITILDNTKPQTIIARTKKEILEGAGSKYILTSPNQVLKHFKKGEKYAFVGLPCQIHGIRKLQKNNNKLAKQIVFCIGIFCGRTMHPKATDYIVNKLKHSSNYLKELNYREGKWPKGFFIKTTNNKIYRLHKHYYDIFNLMFNPKRCLVCPDYTNEFADISVGDCWMREKQGYSTIVIRTTKGKIIYNLAKELIIQNSILNSKDIIKTHPNFKYKQGAIQRGRWLNLFPKYDIYPKNFSYFKTRIFYLIIRTLMTKTAKKIIQKIPLKLIGAAVHSRRWLTAPSRNWTLKDVGKHWDATEDYDDINKETYSYFRRFLDGHRMSDIDTGSYVLDICCRTANGAIYFAKQRNVRGVCMDLTDKMMKIADKAIKQEKIKFVTKKFTDYNLPAKDSEFDAILCFETIEHIPDIQSFTKELNRVLRMNGEIIITMPNFLWEPIHWFAAITKLHHSEGPHRFLRKKQVLKLIRENGFKIKKQETTVLIPYGPKFLTNLGEKFENKFKNTIMPLIGLRRIFVCEKIKDVKQES